MESFLRKKFILRKTYASAGPEKTQSVGRSFAAGLKPGQTAGLLGDLGAGKTHFVKGLAVFLGYKAADIVSPTFSIVKEHVTANVKLYHYDLYRLANEEELEKTGYRDFITDEKSLTVVEWPDRIKQTWKDYSWVVKIEHTGGNKREIRIYEARLNNPEGKKMMQTKKKSACSKRKHLKQAKRQIRS